jgi:transposase
MYSREPRPDCKQFVIVFIANVDGFPFRCETVDGNRRDLRTLEAILRLARKCGKSRRVWSSKDGSSAKIISCGK